MSNSLNVSGSGFWNRLLGAQVLAILPPALLTPLDGATGQPVTMDLFWKKVSNATAYRLQVSTSSNFSTFFVNDTNVVDTTYHLTSLTNGQSYYWRVASKNVSGSSSFSDARTFATIVLPPGIPSLLLPTANAIEVKINPVLKWQIVAGTTEYHAQYSTDSTFVTSKTDTTTADSLQLSALTYLTDYYWRVRARNAAGTSAFSTRRTFKTIIAAPDVPTLLLPADAATVIPITVNLSWNAANRAAKYRVQVSSAADFISTLVDVDTVAQTTYVLHNLTNFQPYYWRVQALNAGGSSSFSASRLFNTSIELPAVPLLATPLDSAVNQLLSPRLTWRTAARADQYKLQVSDSSDFLSGTVTNSTLIDTTTVVGPLGYKKLYYWRVKASNAAGESGYSTVRRFTTVIAPPSAVTLVQPADSIQFLTNSVFFSWSSSPTAIAYQFQISLVSNFSSLLIHRDSITQTSTQVDSLRSDAPFYWRVRAFNAGGNSNFSITRVFTVLSSPDSTIAATPASGAVKVPIPATLTWLETPRAASYQVQVAVDSQFNSRVVDSSNVGDAFLIVENLSLEKTYYWRVRATNARGSGPYSSRMKFTTRSATPDAPILKSPADNAPNRPITMTLAWDTVAGATTYGVELDTTNSVFDNVILHVDTVTQSSMILIGLQNATTYFWRVRSINDNGISQYSSPRSFTTIVDTPDVPINTQPNDGAIDLPLTFALSWDPAPRATSYGVQVSAANNFSSFILNTDTISQTSVNLTGLANIKVYYWKVRAINIGGPSQYTSIQSFTTVDLPPDAPVAALPANGSIQNPKTLQLVWRSAKRATSYRVQLSKSTLFSTLDVDSAGIVDTSVTPIGIAYSTPYYWRVRSENGGGTSSFTGARTFTTQAAVKPADPSLLTATGITKSRIDLAWSDNSDDEDGFKIQRRLYPSGSFAEVHSIAGSTGTGTVSYADTGLAEATIYEYRVYAFNPAGLSVGSTNAASDTTVDQTAPGIPLNPQVLPTGWSSTTLNLQWTNPNESAPAPKPISKLWYRFNAAPDVGTPGSSIAVNGLTVVQIPSPPVGKNQIYFYLEDGGGNKNPSNNSNAQLKFDNLLPVIIHNNAAVPRVVVMNGNVLGGLGAIISASASDGPGEAGVSSFGMQYRRVGVATYSPFTPFPSLTNSSLTIPASEFVSNGKAFAVNYRILASDSAGNSVVAGDYSVAVKDSTPPASPQPIPAAQTGGASVEVKAYRMFSVPYDLDNKKPSSFVESSLGPHVKDGVDYYNWKMTMYNSSTNSFTNYEQFKNTDAVVKGKAFFLIVREPGTKRMQVGSGELVKAREMYDTGIPLAQGWNLIGDPFTTILPWDSLWISAGAGTVTRAYYNGDGPTSGWWVNGDSANFLRPWEGLAIKVTNPATLKFRAVGLVPSGAGGSDDLKVAAGGRSIDNSDIRWSLKMNAYRMDNDMREVGNVAGMASGASADIDPLDKYQPPFFGGNSVAMYFRNPGGGLMQDVRPVNDSGAVWDVRLLTGDRNAPIKLTTESVSEAVAEGFEVYLFDIEERIAYDLQKRSEIQISSKSGERNFKLVVGRKSFVDQNSAGISLLPEQFQLFSNYPNPFNPTTTIRYSLPAGEERYQVRLTVFNALGQELKQLLAAEQSPGYYDMHFNVSEANRAEVTLSSGVYFYRLIAIGSKKGSVLTAVRRMVLLK
jgi:hypothetical protein